MNERGLALPLTLLSLLLMSALAGVVLLSARMRWQSGERSLEALQARVHAESEVERAIGTWDPLRADSLGVGAVIPLPAGPSAPGLSARDSLLRLGVGLYLVRSVGLRTAADGTILARDGVARLVRLIAPMLPDTAAVLAAGDAEITGLAQVDGSDHTPTGWTGFCAVPGPAGVGVSLGPGARITQSCAGGACVVGSPAIGHDSTLTPARLGQLGPVPLQQAMQSADHHVDGTVIALAPSLSGSGCNQADSLNWGEPSAAGTPCSAYFPVIEARPGTRLTGGRGQGLLLAAGALELSGDVEFAGVVLGAGPVTLRDQARIEGLVVSQDSLRVEGTAIVARSSCAIGRALRGAARPSRAVERGWFQWN